MSTISNKRALLFFFLVAFVLRFFSFFYTVIDHDESTYLVMAQQMLDGKLLYVDVWDTKPAGIFLIFATILKLFGHSVFWIRFSACVVVALTAHMLFLVKRKMQIPMHAALLSGMIYIVLMSSYRFGMAVNTELFFNFFVILGLFHFIKAKSKWRQLVAGFFWGVGFIIKYVVVFDVFAIVFASFLVLVILDKEKSFINALLGYLVAGFGFFIPFLMCNLYFYTTGYFEEFFFATFEVARKYSSEIVMTTALKFVMNFHLKFLPIALIFYTVLLSKVNEFKKDKLGTLMPVFWFGFVWIATILPGKYFGHYYSQLFLSVSFLSGDLLLIEGRLSKSIQNHGKRWLIGTSLVIMSLIFGNQAYFFINKDVPREIADYLNKHINKGDQIYAGKKLQVLYFLTHTAPPTKYVHPTLLTFPSHVRTLGINSNEEFDKILKKKPRFMAFKAPHPNSYFMNEVKKSYREIEQFKGNIVLFSLDKK